MSDKETKSGVRTDLSPKQFSEGMNKVSGVKGTKGTSKLRGFFRKANDLLSSFGLMPVITTDSSTSHKNQEGHHYHAPQPSLRENYRVEHTPRPRTHEERVREEIAFRAYMDLVDGKGDHDCDHEH